MASGRNKRKRERTLKLGRQFMAQVGQIVASQIVTRALHLGYGIKDKPHKTHKQRRGKGESLGAYSKTHGKKRQKSGKDISSVRLYFTGNMSRQFRLIESKVTKTKAPIGFTGQSVRYGIYTHKQRPWIGISRQDRKAIEISVCKLFEKLLRRR